MRRVVIGLVLTVVVGCAKDDKPTPPVTPTGGCCAPAGTCTVTTQAACSGTWTGGGVCQPNPCFGDNSIVAWGGDEFGQRNIPPPNAGFAAVATGYAHNLGLKAAGSIVAWGWIEFGQCDIPSPNANFVAAAAGSRHSLGVKSDGTIVAWGRNSAGQCDVPSPNAGFVAVAAGASHSLGLKSNGSVVAGGPTAKASATFPCRTLAS